MESITELSTRELEGFIHDAPEDLQVEWRTLTLREREIVLAAIRDSKVAEVLQEIDFKRVPVSPTEFLENPYYVGENMIWNEREETGIYPHWKKEMCYVLDPENEIVEHILSGSLGAGKTTVAVVELLYKLYWLSCLRNPHAYVGLAPTAPIDIVLFNINLRVSEDAGLNKLEIILNNSPYFRETFPVGRRRRGRGYDPRDYKLELPPYLRVVEASRDTHTISRDVLGGMLDEVNFVAQAKGTGSLNYDSTSKAFSLYQGLQNRIRSRFLRDGKVAGSLLCLCSSAATQFDFLEQHKRAQRKKIDEAAAKGEKAHVHISEFALYDITPWRFRGPRFPVLIGTAQSNSRILASEAEVSLCRAEGKIVLEVPEVFRDQYMADLPRALKEISGVPSEIVSPLFPMREQVAATIDSKRRHPFITESPAIGHLTGPSLESFLIPQELAVWSGGSLVPRHFPQSARVIHVDLSKTQCATGISMGCVSGYKEVRSYNFDPDSKSTTIAPMIWVDFTLRIAPPPPPEEIGYEQIHVFINFLKHTLGFPIARITFDGFQSTFLIQVLQNEGYESEVLSVDLKPDPYFALKAAVMEGRLNRYEYPPLERELYGLRLLSEGKKVWIEKPAGGEKDVADSLAGVAQQCTELPKDSYSPQMRRPGSNAPVPFIRA